MGLSSAGIGSNLDVDGIVSKLMSVERQPLTKLARREASYQAKLSGFGTLKGALSAFQSAVKGLSELSRFQGVRVTPADATIATASASTGATPGNYSLKVTTLAQAQKLVAAGTTSSSAAVGKGVISFDFGTTGVGSFVSSGTGIKTVTIDDTNNSLAGIRDAINKAAVGVTATIVNDGSGTPYRLALTSDKTGALNSMKISVANTAPDTGLSTLLNHDPAGAQTLTQTATAQDAAFSVDGIAVTKSSNTVTDVISGVTLNLLKENPATATTITVERDTASITSAVNAFVKAYNDINQNLNDAAAYDPSTKQAAILNGEASVRGIQGQLRAVLSAPVAGGASVFTQLSEIGVTVQKSGMLAVDSSKLTTALTSNFGDFAGLFAAVGKSSDSLVSYSTATSATKAGAYAVNVTSLATKGSTTGTAPAGLLIDGTNNTLDVLLNGLTATITLQQKTYLSAADLAAEVQSKINGVAAFSAAGFSVAATGTGGTLALTSSRYGSASTISITGGNGQANLKFVATGATVLTGADVAGTINGTAATGNGQVLTSSGGDSTGLAVTVSSGLTGPRGTLNYSQGYAYQFDKLSTDMLSATGSLAARTDGISSSIKTLGKTQEAMLARLAVVEKRYRAQFSALDLVISSMNTTSSFLSQQLDQLSRMSSGE